MSDRRFRGMVLALALGSSLAALPVLARHDPHGGQGGGPMHRRMALPAIHILHELELSTEQRDQIHSIVRRYHEDGLPARVEAVQQARQAHQLSVWDPKASDAELSSTADAVADRARDVDAVLHRMAAEILGVLTEDQRAEFRTRLSETPDGPDGPPMGSHSMRRQGGPGTPER
jgi:Spy/CpxP family protein refolding chaperone